jgi:triphosphatase
MVEHSSDPREIEIKLELDALGIVRLQDDVKLRNVPRHTSRLVSRYFDTDDQLVRSKGLTWRVRTVGDRFVQTIKAQISPAAGLHDRSEWEFHINSQEPDLDAASHTPLKDLLDLDNIRGKLKPVFETDIERTSWHVQSGTSNIVVACDQGRIVAGDAAADIAELELELTDCSLADLFSLAKELASRSGAQIGVLSKSERGYALLARQGPCAAKADAVPISPNMGGAEAFKIIARSCTRQFRINQPLVETKRDVEALHQARVSLRRLRTALSIFKTMVASNELGRIETRLTCIFRNLGRARNLDIYLATLRQDASKEPSSVASLRKVTRSRESAYDKVIAQLASGEYRSLVLDLSAYVEIGAWQSRDPASRRKTERPIVKFAAKALDRRWRRLRKTKQNLNKLKPRELHRLRILIKALRYACEFFRGAFPKPKAERRYRAFIDRLGKLQDQLGTLNDLSTSRKLERKVVRASRGKSASDIAMQSKRDLVKLTSAAAAHRGLTKAKPFW